VATPDPFSVAAPKIDVPSLTVTVPVGVPAPPPLATTVTVNVTDCPETEGLCDDVTVVPVGDLFTV
jgi:hypothetical protein